MSCASRCRCARAVVLHPRRAPPDPSRCDAQASDSVRVECGKLHGVCRNHGQMIDNMGAKQAACDEKVGRMEAQVDEARRDVSSLAATVQSFETKLNGVERRHDAATGSPYVKRELIKV